MPPASFVHLIGSVPLDTPSEAMQTACSNLPNRLYTLPDGETGERNMYVLWQVKRVFPKEVLAHKPAWNNLPIPSEKLKKFNLKKEDLPSTTGYADHALSSYKLFCTLRDEGKIPQGVKFQVSLPSPTSVVGLILHPDYQEEGEQLYEELLRADLKTIQDSIPHRDLAIQWDVLAEIAFMEHAYGRPRKTENWFFAQLRPFFEPVREGIVKRMARLAQPIAKDVDMGVHFCYGDAQQEHFVQPVDASFLAEMVNISIQNMPHRIDWAHVPVPADRTDDAYFAALKSLELGKTKLVLGLVHANDDEGTKKRMATAQKALPDVPFGISTECGLGRRSKEDLPSILQICRDNSEAH